jgi:hypothetical protein
MVTVAIRALELEYLVKILDWGRSRYFFTYSGSELVLFYLLRLRLHDSAALEEFPKCPFFERDLLDFDQDILISLSVL